MAEKRVTSADVAREAGVSRATVSYVLNSTPNQKIAASTRNRILAAAARLGYAPSAAARALRTGRSDVVLCLLPDWPISPTIARILEHLTTHLAERDLTLVTHVRAPACRSTSEIWKAITPAAIIAYEQLDDDTLAAIRAAGITATVVLFGRSGGPLVTAQERAGRLQAEHLAAAGHRQIGYAYPEDPRLRVLAEPRLAGVRAACAELGLPQPDVRAVPLDPAAAADPVRVWHNADYSGICAFNDEVALAVLAGAHTSGLAALGDLAVIGVGDLAVARLTSPALTTVALDTAALADAMTATVLAALAGQPATRSPDSARVIVRASA
ncbi:LacI family transcriptional regulator [Longimycelium tulufanense]|uniref:LacI family transcriptional regulator n=1 Tax=Longimycelium tulufanense TaxID=907463 RepID=A0A8J3FUE1_9PSEU|nr:LacI family DNA-binding transcriptional regulator [Longimycelium tulufanense]GGM34201.1 LacI family transcriptional regulator [Longimycelium tulufanense]